MVNPGFRAILREISLLQRQLGNLVDIGFTSGWQEAGRAGAEGWIPPIDLFEGDTGYVLYVDLPGLAREDVRLEMKGNALALSGSRPYERGEDPESVFRFERPHGAFNREIELPANIDEEKIEAQLADGVLIIRLLFKQPKGGREIPVR
jgi:HSP20 family protein